MDSNLKARAQKIKLVIFDVDGVMTDGSLFIGDDGQEYKMFNTQDGLGMRLLKKSGVKLAIITGRNSNSVLIRAENLEVDYFYQGISDKKEAFHDLLKKTGLKPEECVGIEDAISGVKAIKSAHMYAIGIGNPSLLNEADIVFDSVENIDFEFLEELIGDKNG